MINKTILLKDYYKGIKTHATLTSYCISNHEEYPFQRKRKTILIIPGGGYEFVSKREGEPIALKFLAHDFNCFVLDYTVGEFDYPYPIIEGFAALAYIRTHAEEYNVDLNSVSVLGFSAGGHFAATLSCYQNYQQFADILHENPINFKINNCILAYPVITMDYRTHGGTRDHIAHGNEELLDFFSIEKHVTKDFPRTYIWTTKEDTCVPFINSTLLKDSLDKVNVECVCRLFEHGEHGGATCDALTCQEIDINRLKEASCWIDEAMEFIK